jgi:tetratricopeptide (TPR) repeat protein
LKYPDFAKGDPYIFLADVIQVERSIEIHCHIARTMSYRHFNLVGANREYQKAIEMAQKIGSEEKLKDIYLEYALSLTDVRLRKGDPKALQAVESYIALDKSNYKMYACLGVARLQLQDRKGAIEAFREALSLNNRDNLVVRALVSSLRSAADFEGMIELFDNYDLDTTTFWIRGQLEYESFQEAMFYAARKTDKVELLIKRYKHAMQTTWDHSSGQGEDDKLDPLWDELGEARGCANEHKFYSAGTSLLHCWLAVLCRRYLGQPDAAFDHWKAAFLQRSEIFKLSNVSSMFTDSIFPDMFAQFAELLYDKALGPGGSVDENMLTILERVCQRQDAFRKSAPYVTTLSGPKSIDLLLARLYIRCEMKEEAEALLNEQFRHGIDMLKGTITWSDRDAYRILSRILFISDHINEAKIALSLRRFLRFKHTAIENSNVDKNEDSKADETLAGIEETTYGRRPGFKCASREDCPGKGRVGLGEPMYSCMTCIEVDFCEECYDALMRNERTKGKKLIYVCDYNHEFLSSPLEDWEIKDGVMTISGEKVRVAEWVDIVEKKWNSGHKL